MMTISEIRKLQDLTPKPYKYIFECYHLIPHEMGISISPHYVPFTSEIGEAFRKNEEYMTAFINEINEATKQYTVDETPFIDFIKDGKPDLDKIKSIDIELNKIHEELMFYRDNVNNFKYADYLTDLQDYKYYELFKLKYST